MEKWKDKVALITGGSSGIGESTARLLYKHGLRVAVCARRLEKLHAIQQDLSAPDARFLCIQTDLRDEDSILKMFATVRDTWGGVDILVNNAGIGHMASLMTGATQDWKEMLDVNVLALCVCTREAVQDMRSRGDQGHVIHISSMSGHRVPARSAMYAATKYAVRALTEALRLELRVAKSAIRITSISPGTVETEFAYQLTKSEEIAKEIYSEFKVLEAIDIAKTVQYVLESPLHMEVNDVLIRPTAQKT